MNRGEKRKYRGKKKVVSRAKQKREEQKKNK
jgi:hypothetical protein